MIDPLSETIVSLPDAAVLYCPLRHGKKPHISCLYRWTNTGCRGVVLESIQVGATRCTSREALARFFLRLTSQAQNGSESTKISSPIAAPTNNLVEQQLDAMGI